MKAVILAAGRGKRMRELTTSTPKPLLKYKNKTLLERKLDVLPDEISEVIIVIGYLGDKIKRHLGKSYKDKKIRYIEQKEKLGTAHALWQCKKHLKENFIVLMGDDIYSEKDIKKLASTPENEWSILTYRATAPETAGKCIVNNEGYLVTLIKDIPCEVNDLIYTGACCLSPEVFKQEMVKLDNGEYGLPQTFSRLIKEKNIKIYITKDWERITTPENLR